MPRLMRQPQRRFGLGPELHIDSAQMCLLPLLTLCWLALPFILKGHTKAKTRISQPLQLCAFYTQATFQIKTSAWETPLICLMAILYYQSLKAEDTWECRYLIYTVLFQNKGHPCFLHVWWNKIFPRKIRETGNPEWNLCLMARKAADRRSLGRTLCLYPITLSFLVQTIFSYRCHLIALSWDTVWLWGNAG